MLVPGTVSNFGSPSYGTVSLAVARSMAAVCGICASITASEACVVPGTDARTSAFAEDGGIFANDLGSESGRTNVHGPANEADANQRPDASTYVFCVPRSLKMSRSVLLT